MASGAEDVWTLRNEQTGEVGIFDPATVRVLRRSHGRHGHPYSQPGRFAWYTVSSDAYEAAFRSLRKLSEHRVFAVLPLLMGRDNVLHVFQRDIAERAGLTVPPVSRAMTALRRELIIGKVEGSLRFSPEIAWKGRAGDLDWMLQAWREAKVGWIAERKKELRRQGPSAAPDNLP